MGPAVADASRPRCRSRRRIGRRRGRRRDVVGAMRRGFFIFIFFISIFYKNIFSIWKFIEIYPGHPAAGRQGLICKRKRKKITDRSLGTGRPAAGRLAPHPYIRCWLPLTPSFALLKIQKKKSEKEGEEG